MGVTIRVVANAVAATTDRMASASLGDLAVVVIAVNIGDVGAGRRRTVVLTRGVGDAGGGACGVFGRLVAEGVCGVLMPWVGAGVWGV